MSWTLIIPATPAAEWDTTVDATEAQPADPPRAVDGVEPAPVQLTAEEAAHVTAAKTAIKQLAASGALGAPATLEASARGNANPGHTPAAGEDGDVITISIAHA